MRSEERIQEMLDAAKGNLAIEGIYLSQEEEELIKSKIRGEITHEEFLKKAKELALKG